MVNSIMRMEIFKLAALLRCACACISITPTIVVPRAIPQTAVDMLENHIPALEVIIRIWVTVFSLIVLGDSTF